MRNHILIAMLTCLSFWAVAQNGLIHGTYNQESINQARKSGEVLLMNESTIALGSIKKGEKKEFKFYFLNISDEIIEYDFFDVCSCSEVIYDQYAKIKPGEEASFKIIFDSSQKEIEELIEVNFQLKNMDKRIDLPYFYTVHYSYEFAK